MMEREFPIDGHVELEEAVAAAREGETVVLTQKGQRVANVYATAMGDHDREVAREAVERLIERRKRLSLGGTPIRELIDEGRK